MDRSSKQRQQRRRRRRMSVRVPALLQLRDVMRVRTLVLARLTRPVLGGSGSLPAKTYGGKAELISSHRHPLVSTHRARFGCRVGVDSPHLLM